jgi:hypothetical protein
VGDTVISVPTLLRVNSANSDAAPRPPVLLRNPRTSIDRSELTYALVLDLGPASAPNPEPFGCLPNPLLIGSLPCYYLTTYFLFEIASSPTLLSYSRTIVTIAYFSINTLHVLEVLQFVNKR